jgi:hypothetical protein
LQHRVHVYEWSDSELRGVLADLGLIVEAVVGLLPSPPEELADALARAYGPGAAAWYEQLRAVVPVTRSWPQQHARFAATGKPRHPVRCR